MVPVKFRVWDSISKRLFLPQEKKFILRSDGNLSTINGTGDPGYIAQFSTGMKDSNNIEIFDGDILIYESLGHNFCEKVSWDAPGWSTQSKTGKFSNPFSPCIKYSVVGNVMENRGLLPED